MKAGLELEQFVEKSNLNKINKLLLGRSLSKLTNYKPVE
jgi:hypothetical protein